MEVPDGFVLIQESVLIAIGGAVVAIGATLCGAIRALYLGNQASAEVNRQIIRDVTAAEKEDAVFKEKLTAGLKEVREEQKSLRSSIHGRFDKWERGNP